MRKLTFTKMAASGNDFIISDSISPHPVISLKKLAQKICDRKFGVGADGLLVLEKSKIADIKMRIFNADGSEAQMCGNGARCIAFYLKKRNLTIETKAGIIESQINGENVKIKLTDPRDIRLNIPININGRKLKVNFINTGVPHVVIFVEGLDKMDVFNLGKDVRYHARFKPAGANVNFVEVLSKNSLKLRTYERGVEDETLACGTGVVASALLTSYKLGFASDTKIDVLTKSREILKVYFNKIKNKFNNIWLEGKVNIICQGDYYV